MSQNKWEYFDEVTMSFYFTWGFELSRVSTLPGEFFKGVLLVFLNLIQCVVCGHETIEKVTNLKVHSKGRYFSFKKSLFKNYNEHLD